LAAEALMNLYFDIKERPRVGTPTLRPIGPQAATFAE
jgi:hypothetical protein